VHMCDAYHVFCTHMRNFPGHGSDDDGDEGDEDPFAYILASERLCEPVHPGDDGTGPTVLEAVLQLLDIVTTNKLTDKSGKDLWDTVAAMLPEEHNLPSFREARKIIDQCGVASCKKYDACKNMCVLYADLPATKRLPAYKHGHRTRYILCAHTITLCAHLVVRARTRVAMCAHTITLCARILCVMCAHSGVHMRACLYIMRSCGVYVRRCPRCQEARHTTEGKPRRVVYHFPLEHWGRGLCKDPELVAQMRRPAFMWPDSTLQRSRGWRQKMVHDRKMAADCLGLGCFGSADGVPFFSDQHRSGWPTTVQCASLPTEVAQPRRRISFTCTH